MVCRDAAKLQGLLLPFAMRIGQWFVQYTEDECVKNVEVDREAITAQIELLLSLRTASPTWVFPKSTVTKALKGVRKELGWDVDDKWLSRMTNRIRNICRAAAQTARRETQWAARLGLAPAPRAGADYDAEVDTAVTAEVRYCHQTAHMPLSLEHVSPSARNPNVGIRQRARPGPTSKLRSPPGANPRRSS